MNDVDLWIKRADEVLAGGHSTAAASEQLLFATSILSRFYGPSSPEMKTFRETSEGIQRLKEGTQHHLQMHARATIKAVKAQVEAGLAKNTRAIIAGENIAEFLALAKDVMHDGSDAAKNVGAVLVAAAFEDLVRRMGSEFASVTDRRDLQDVIGAVKAAGVLNGGEPTTALGYLRFRNDSLHADWSKVERSQIESCVAFMEQLLIKHFS